MSFNKILEKYRKVSFSERDKGDRFERLMQAYLQTDPLYADRFKKVWLWNEFPGRNDLGGGDTGIDLVALTFEGDYWAIQCKCYQETTIIDKPAVDTFLSTSSKEFKDDNMRTTRFTQRLWISTSNNWGHNATEAIKNQHPPVIRINLYDLQEAPVDWDKLEKGIHGEESRTPKKRLRPHQKLALEKAHEHFKTTDRGKLIMACGTGKTFNTLRIAEHETSGKGLILFLVPSIALLGQILREWSTDAKEKINAVCICSDPEVSKSKSKNEDKNTFSIVDLALPASTNVTEIISQIKPMRTNKSPGMTVVFSTYQSIEVIARAQKELLKEGLGEFDIIICDEAHRTTGVTLSGDDDSAFVKVHDNDFIKGKKRIYMTATPRLYNDDIKSKAAQADAVLCSMDDPELYGEEIYRIGFGEAVERDLLSDYKVLILTLNENDVPPAIQKMIADKESEINTDDASKLIGTINALSKQVLGDEGSIKSSDPEPMKRAVAFCQKIVVSKKISALYNTASEAYINDLPNDKRGGMVSVESKHIDGTMTAPQRNELLSWLKSSGENNECRILTNVRCLSEGVDVPSLDAVMFLSARNSQVDVVQSVGRVMRKSPNKKYGYIIIPVVVPTNVEADKALDDNERYKVVWTVLNALRAHDDRFNATVNKIELNRKRPNNILIGRPGTSWVDGDPVDGDPDTSREATKDISQQLAIQFEQLQHVVYARMVQKVGDRRYWEQWAKSVAEIAQRQGERISRLIKEDKSHKQAFKDFLYGLQKNINPSITQQEAIEMLSQHIITKPVFEALFEEYSFVKNNPISIAMQTMLDLLEAQTIEKDTEILERFYDSVRKRAADIDNAEGKQHIVIELYDKFFKTAFPRMVEKLGIVYTPVEVVDFIIQSVNDVLKKEFGRNISDENIHILDPFTGTGTFITRLLQSGLIEEKDLERKYKHELHANEIVLLAYYIAAINIENAYHDATPVPIDVIGKENYTPFEGIVLTDTFQLGETDDAEKIFSEMFPKNSERVQRQQKAPLRIIIGNPPYSVGQKSADDNAQNQEYSRLDKRISDTYQAIATGTGKRALYDAYIKAFRWSTDRLDKTGGIICFISNSSWLDGLATAGFRLYLEKEFSSIYVFNLRGNANSKGEFRRKESGNVFGSGSKTPVAITLLVKNPEIKTEKATIQYHDIGDYLDREQKIKIIKGFKTFENPKLDLKTLTPNEHGDWLNKRNKQFEIFIPIGEKDKKMQKHLAFFNPIFSYGIITARDNWVWSFNKSVLADNVEGTIDFYNLERNRFWETKKNNPSIIAKNFISKNPKRISWDNRRLIGGIEGNKKIYYYKTNIRVGNYRPFSKLYNYFSLDISHSLNLQKTYFPTEKSDNLIICISSSLSEGLAILISNGFVDIHYNGDSLCFPLYYYEENNAIQKSLFDTDDEQKYIRRDAISNFIFERAKQQYGKSISKEDIFYYVYGFLHSKEYRETFANDLKKMLPHLPLIEDVKDFWAFSKAGRKLAELHLNYETVAPFDGVQVSGDDGIHYKVVKMRFPQKGQKDTIIYNSRITLTNIPDKAYEYVVNGKSAIEWVMERYQVKIDKTSSIKNDPNDWSKEVGNPRYILDLLLSIINVSVKTVEIVNVLPKLKFE